MRGFETKNSNFIIKYGNKVEVYIAMTDAKDK